MNSSTIPDVVAVQPLGGYLLQVEFDDGVKGNVDLKKVLSFTGVFEPMRDESYFQQVSVHPELHTIMWPNGADFDPVVLHSLVTGKPISFAGQSNGMISDASKAHLAGDR